MKIIQQKNKFISNLENSSQELQEGSKRSYLTKQQYEQFANSREKLVKFINDVKNQYDYSQLSQIRQDILNHCSFTNKIQYTDQNVRTQEILKLVDARIQKMIRTGKIKKNWSQFDIKILVWLISKYCDIRRYSIIQKTFVTYSIIKDYQDWNFISKLIPGSTPNSCMFKWLNLKKTKITVKNWSEQEADCLKSIIEEQLKKNQSQSVKLNWKQISEKLYVTNQEKDKIFRNQKQCKQHWNCYLNPNLKKGPWEQEEDVLLLKTVKQNDCQKKWAQIAKYFNGRTQNALRNRYNLIIEKQKKYRSTINEMDLIDDYIARCQAEQFTLYEPDQQCDKIKIQSNKKQVLKQEKKISQINQMVTKYENDEIFYPIAQSIQAIQKDEYFSFLEENPQNQDKQKKQENNCVKK